MHKLALNYFYPSDKSFFPSGIDQTSNNHPLGPNYILAAPLFSKRSNSLVHNHKPQVDQQCELRRWINLLFQYIGVCLFIGHKGVIFIM